VRTRVFTTLAIVMVLFVTAFGQAKKGQKAPDFTLPDLEGNNVTLSKIIGNGPIYINFWATWCSPCKKEIPELIKLHKKYADRGLKILGISVDDSRTQGKVKSFVKDRNMNFTILLDSSSEVLKRKYKCIGIPYGFLLDNEGNIIHSIRGFMPGLEEILTSKMKPYLIEPEKKKPAKDKTEEEPAKKVVPPSKSKTKK